MFRKLILCLVFIFVFIGSASSACLTDECLDRMANQPIRGPQNDAPPIGCSAQTVSTCHPLYDWWCPNDLACAVYEFSWPDVYNANDGIKWHEHWRSCRTHKAQIEGQLEEANKLIENLILGKCKVKNKTIVCR
jgi:hypothetical protein